jgi:histidine triad (HIT) family protein
MSIPYEQINQLKQQIINQILSSFPQEKQQEAVDHINSMNNDEFINFLKQNNLIKDSEKESDSKKDSEDNDKTPFRLIVEEKIPSYKLDENKEAVAVLEINPVSKGHLLIIPKIPVKDSEKIPQSAFSLAKKLSKKINTRYKPKEILISSSIVLGEAIINILPKYTNETLSSERRSATKEELEKLKQELEVKKRAKTLRKPRTKKVENREIWIPKRIP